MVASSRQPLGDDGLVLVVIPRPDHSARLAYAGAGGRKQSARTPSRPGVCLMLVVAKYLRQAPVTVRRRAGRRPPGRAARRLPAPRGAASLPGGSPLSPLPVPT